MNSDDGVDSDDYVTVLEAQMDRDYQEYLDRKGTKSKRVRLGKKSKLLVGTMPVVNTGLDHDEPLGVVDMDSGKIKNSGGKRTAGVAARHVQSDDDDDHYGEIDGDDTELPLVRSERLSIAAQAQLWFSQSQFAGLESDDDAEAEEENRVADDSDNEHGFFDDDCGLDKDQSQSGAHSAQAEDDDILADNMEVSYTGADSVFSCLPPLFYSRRKICFF